MADRYQGKSSAADDDYDHGTPRAPAKGDSDPLAELARLIGQTDPFSGFGRANQPMPPRQADPYRRPEPEPDPEPEIDEAPPAGPPPWMQRAAQQEAAPQLDFDTSVHPLRRYAAAHPPVEPEYHEAPPFAAEPDQHEQADPARYDDALYGQPDPGTYEAQQRDAAYADDPYAYQDGYGEEAEEDQKPRRGGMITVVAVLALAVVGTGGAFAYRTYMGSPRGGEPPIIRADASPTKVVPAPSGDGVAKVPDRMTTGGAEKIVPREEAPVDVNAGPRQVFPPVNQNANPPTAAIVPPAAKPPAAPTAPTAPGASGTLAGDEPRKIRTLAVKGDPADVAATPAPKPAATPRPVPSPAATRAPAPSPAANANASANAPLSLSPQGAQPAPADTRTRVASTNAAQATPSAGGSYVVQVSSQRSEADAQASFKALQGKFPSVLGSRAPLIKRADLGDKGVYYRAMVGPFASSEEASQVCGNLKTAGGQCVVQKN
jgi:SPOR domain